MGYNYPDEDGPGRGGSDATKALGLEGSKVLWGRVVVLVIVLQLVFFMGRACAPGVPQAELDETKQELAEARAELARAKASPTPTPMPTPTPTPTVAPTATPAAETQTYVVRPGDTLAEIAEDFYKDTKLAGFIAQTNQITNSTQLKVGQKLTIPPKPTATPAGGATPTSTARPTATTRP